MVNYYELLEIHHSATIDEINKAYKSKALLFHPDKNNGSAAAEAMFKMLGQAKETLLDSSKRLEHDYATGVKKRPEPQPRIIHVPAKETSSNGNGGWMALAFLALLAGIAIGGSNDKRG
jgi:curved DNA-binding protein CbpA